MSSINLDDGTWTIGGLKAKVASHALFKQHGMEMPAKIAEQDLKSAARLFDRHDSSTTIADGKDPRPLEYHNRFYAINPDLRPMAAAAGLKNTHGKEFSNGGLARWLQRWDVDHAPRMAMFLPRLKKDVKAAVPKPVAQAQNTTESESATSKKRKARSTVPSAPPKRQNRSTTTTEDDVEMSDHDDPIDDTSHSQPTIKGRASTRTLRLKYTRARGSQAGQAMATQSHLNASPDSVRRLPRNVAKNQDDNMGKIAQEGNEELETDIEQSQRPGGGRRGLEMRATRHGQALKKTAEQLAEERRKKEEERRKKEEEEELRKHNSRRLGRYSDPLLADAYRVKHKTVLARMDKHIRPDVKPAPADYLGTRRLYEREVDRAKEEGRDLDLWMGGPSP
ncbi:hypothetical protein ACET3X_007883 [Alternaria dauci]|uniref:Uncharacterized protein n=1 Tax=Alternaria dauci TaxID=48095 RepID=A0ABR3UE45_9PLEO